MITLALNASHAVGAISPNTTSRKNSDKEANGKTTGGGVHEGLVSPAYQVGISGLVTKTLDYAHGETHSTSNNSRPMTFALVHAIGNARDNQCPPSTDTPLIEIEIGPLSLSSHLQRRRGTALVSPNLTFYFCSCPPIVKRRDFGPPNRPPSCDSALPARQAQGTIVADACFQYSSFLRV